MSVLVIIIHGSILLLFLLFVFGVGQGGCGSGIGRCWGCVCILHVS